eukprot:Skav225062  [mRNA]  locus=scaffold2293:21259:24786:- [translate_table: standard]
MKPGSAEGVQQASTLHGLGGGSNDDLGTMSRDRRHGDPFPLPLIDDEFMELHGCDQGLQPMHLRLANEAVKSANALAGAHMRVTRNPSTLRAPRAPDGRTAIQVEMTKDILEKVAQIPSPPDDMTEEGCLRDLMGASYLYGEANHLASYNPDKIKIFKRRLTPMDARSLCPPEVRRQLELFPQFIERTEDEISTLYPDGLQVEPYWDPALRRDRKLREDLYVRLWNTGLLTFRRRRKALVAFFCVKKKDGMQRLICDARQANKCHRAPPSTQLSTPTSFSSIDLTDYNLMGQGFGEIFGLHDADGFSPATSCRGAEGDVGDCFYNFSIEELASWFSTRDSFNTHHLEKLGILPDYIYDDELRDFDAVRVGETLIPCFRGVCMGWAWALHLAQSIVTYQISLPVGGCQRDLLLDRKVAPDPTPNRPVVGTYVDNVQVLGGNHDGVADRMEGIVKQFQQLGIPFVTSGDEPLAKFETLGLVFDVKNRKIRHRHQRSWRLYMATRCLLKRGRLRGETLRVWLGHVIHHFQLCRSAMLAVHSCYRFVEASLGKRMEVWPSVRFEMRLVLGLIFQGQADLALPYSRVAYLGDSSTHGYSLMATECSEQEVKKAMRSHERWRFLEAEAYVPEGVFNHKSSQVIGQAAESRPLGLSTEYGKKLEASILDDRIAKKKSVRMDKDKYLKSTRKITVEVPSLCEKLDSKWHDPGRYKLLVARAWKHKQEHINLQEAPVCLMGLRRQCRTRSGLRQRLLTLSDNLACVLAFSKGRSGSYGMNQLVRRSAAYCLFGGIQWHLRHVRSEDNVADESSRWHDPQSSLAKWKKEEARRCEDIGMKEELTRCESRHDLTPQKVPVSSEGEKQDNSSSWRSTIPRAPLIAYLPLFFLEVFAGSGRLTSSMAWHGMAHLAAFEIYNGLEFDLTRPATQAVVMGLIQLGLVWYLHLGLPCTCWSRARHNIKNVARAQAREMVSVELTLFAVALCIEQVRLGWFFSIENPASSRLFEFRPIVDLMGMHGVFRVTWDSCWYGAPFKKPTSLVTNMASLSQLAQNCTRDHQHVPLVGTERYVDESGKTRSRNRTAGAGEYTWELTHAWAGFAAQQAPAAAWLTDYADFKTVVVRRLQEVAATELSKTSWVGKDKFKRLDIHLGEQPRPLARAKAYRKPIVFGQHTKKEIEFLRSQGA